MSTPTRPAIGPTGIVQGLSSEKPATSIGRVNVVDRWLAAHLQRVIAAAAVRLELWDGSSPYSDASPPVGTLVIHDRWTLLGLSVHPDLYFG